MKPWNEWRGSSNVLVEPIEFDICFLLVNNPCCMENSFLLSQQLPLFLIALIWNTLKNKFKTFLWSRIKHTVTSNPILLLKFCGSSHLTLHLVKKKLTICPNIHFHIFLVFKGLSSVIESCINNVSTIHTEFKFCHR